ncbi:hypothetical protein EVG18_33860 [Burkholderia pyrrocinia]|uniref:hypothetical protein n=1 Tax=Burkholderia pyrrocinia TaxID=60550 RepID=UPI001044532A|nr:hypothetical protein [Burkholderia pyrrocinia]TDA43261.1 hypothetical protein EVG18_33860 [Burkholderia pyrrocinia]
MRRYAWAAGFAARPEQRPPALLTRVVSGDSRLGIDAHRRRPFRHDVPARRRIGDLDCSKKASVCRALVTLPLVRNRHGSVSVRFAYENRKVRLGRD